ncbi:transglycosylase family protein [Pseudonocardia eucalypti]|uniref:Transglycosylase family protein n=1 Tax=Pseudonocardia eucalypti TaxID=648755 RepID=A0ABP9PGT7_9PSEU|nr:LysM repeat protein [Pseudonocardia eucalypti]
MTPSRDTSPEPREDSRGSRNLARVVRVITAGAVVAGTPFLFAGTAHAASDETWDQLAKCESGGKWSTNTGNGFSGGLQFTASTWRANGGKGSAHNASREEQIRVAERVLASQGWKAWPACSKKIKAKGKAQLRDKTNATKDTRTEVKPNVPAVPAAPVPPVAPAPRIPAAVPAPQVPAAVPAPQVPAAVPNVPAPRVPSVPTPAAQVPNVPNAPAPAAPAAPATPAGQKYTVVSGDSLSKIAQTRNLPGGWQALYERNRDQLGGAPNKLKPGQQLNLG